MAGERKPRRRRKVVLVLAAVGVGVWVIRSRRNAVPDAWLPPVPDSAPDSAPDSDARPRHAAASPDEATMDPAPTGDAPKHAAAPATTSNGSGPATSGKDPAVPAAAPTVAGLAAAESDPAPAPEGSAPSGTVSTAGAMTGGTPSALFAEPETATTHGAAPLVDGSAPGPDYVIKGNADSMLFHSQSSPYFGRTRAEVWFRTEEEALAAGFTKWSRRKSG